MKKVVTQPALDPEFKRMVDAVILLNCQDKDIRDPKYHRLSAIKAIRQVFGSGLREAKHLFEVCIEGLEFDLDQMG